MLAFTNLARSKLSGGILAADLTAAVTEAQWATPPTGRELLVLAPPGVLYPTPADVEIVALQSVSGTTLTLSERGLEGTTAKDWPQGTIVSSRLTAGAMDWLVQSDPDHDALGADAVNIQPSRSSPANAATGAGAVAIGPDSKSASTKSVAIGSGASAGSFFAIALGPHADAGAGARNVAAGGLAKIPSIDRAPEHAMTLGNGPAVGASFVCGSPYPRLTQLPHWGWYDGDPQDLQWQSPGGEVQIMSAPLSIGDAVAWQASTSYAHGTVISPGDGYSYMAYIWGSDYFVSATSGATEPTWPAVIGGNVSEGGIDWLCVGAAGVGAEHHFGFPQYSRFIPTRFGVRTDENSGTGVTTAPQIQLGTTSGASEVVAATALSNLDGALHLETVNIPHAGGTSALFASVAVAGAGAAITGQFVLWGILQEVMAP